ncbi:DUF5706 domain-containing protein [Danxiaibacter flavus]|uniref:DUF5706 domain-containing protein n=1 Tax=Danxiaibacter flavus TaxID=3049108 RepID=A0ABV3ZLG6_9BACT|nr:DUF5706 domain-containing protein [Chitinophagaceae bacterium DXS]
MNYQQLLEQAKQFATTFFTEHPDEKLVYHNMQHTERVVTAAKEIANHYQLSDEDFFIVVAAAWFHDAGYYIQPGDHEAAGAQLAADFLQKTSVDEGTIQKVKKCILATKMPQRPETLLEKIVCDADLFHLGTEDFGKVNKLLRKEYMAFHNADIGKDEWNRKTVLFLQQHQYHTDYCRLLLSDTKQQNLEKLMHKIEAKEENASEQITEKTILTPVKDEKEQGHKNKKEKNDRPERGIETMFRITSNNQQRLSDMADSKAHIMISTNSIIISVLLSVLLRKIEDYPHLTIPSVMLLAVCVITTVFSIIATRPKIPSGTFTPEDIRQKKVNLLFFGNFYRMNLEEYTDGMLHMMNDREFLYGSLIKDVYSQGTVLGKKYRMLRISYNVFMFGMVVSVIAFVIASVYFGK